MSTISVTQSDASAIPQETVFDITDLTVRYGSAVAVQGVSLGIHRNTITALIGPSGCG
jgi:ABC-type phosphate transport system ATPase subunit